MDANPNLQRSEANLYERFVTQRVEEVPTDTPVVLIVGPRRTGKTTLVRQMSEVGRS